jgi:hypothetical protein
MTNLPRTTQPDTTTLIGLGLLVFVSLRMNVLLLVRNLENFIPIIDLGLM